MKPSLYTNNPPTIPYQSMNDFLKLTRHASPKDYGEAINDRKQKRREIKKK